MSVCFGNSTGFGREQTFSTASDLKLPHTHVYTVHVCTRRSPQSALTSRPQRFNPEHLIAPLMKNDSPSSEEVFLSEDDGGWAGQPLICLRYQLSESRDCRFLSGRFMMMPSGETLPTQTTLHPSPVDKENKKKTSDCTHCGPFDRWSLCLFL